jgi:hypothetical protein
MDNIAVTVEKGTEYVKISGFPDRCPICKNGIYPKYFGAHDTVSSRPDARRIILIFKCPLEDCRQLFLGYYEEATMGYFVLRRSYWRPFYERVSFAEDINKLSDNFVKIYNEAYMAEGLGLKEICGCGFRRALEFLIKDYLKNIFIDDSKKIGEIEKKFLGRCIEEDIDNIKIKEMAKRAAWLGNDQTHYIKRWEEHDIKNLKELINLTVSYINTELLAKKYTDEMPEE